MWKLKDWYVVDQILLRLLSSVLKQSDLVLFTSFEHSRPANKMASLVLAADFTFGRHVSIWTSYDLKEQFSKLALWIMHWPTIHFLRQHFVFIPSD